MMLNIISCQRNANQTHNEIPLHAHQDSYNKKNNNSAAEDVKKLEPSLTAVGM